MCSRCRAVRPAEGRDGQSQPEPTDKGPRPTTEKKKKVAPIGKVIARRIIVLGKTFPPFVMTNLNTADEAAMCT